HDQGKSGVFRKNCTAGGKSLFLGRSTGKGPGRDCYQQFSSVPGSFYGPSGGIPESGGAGGPYDLAYAAQLYDQRIFRRFENAVSGKEKTGLTKAEAVI